MTLEPVRATTVFVGTYTRNMGGLGRGVHRLRLDEHGLHTLDVLDTPSPSWLTRHPHLPIIYAANETTDGAVTVIDVATHGMRARQTRHVHGDHPCHVAVSPDARLLVTANYTSGTASVFSLAKDGSLFGEPQLLRSDGAGPVTDRQDGPHVHMVSFHPAGTGLTVVDLGSDSLRTYPVSPSADSQVTVSPHPIVMALPAGTGPRQLLRRDNTVYVVGELSNELLVLDETTPGRFQLIGRVPATHRPTPNLPAHLDVDAAGSVWLSNRGAGTLAVFPQLDPGGHATDRGRIRGPTVEHDVGAQVRHFTHTGAMTLVADQGRGTVDVYRRTHPEFVRVAATAVGSPAFTLPW